ncbi:MAG: uracil-DNA glycosylase [Oscillospiraceae bacterium]|nr:uracil-DNA glycosylase [Oscillospiraceae bacterium]
MDWSTLRATCGECRACGLAATRQHVVFGCGPTDAKILFVGEGPGATEDELGEPFVGRAGKLLDLVMDTVGLSRDKNVYIANMVKCRPPGNRDPLPEEQDACLHWLNEQMELLQPAIVVCLGRVAACRLLSPDFKVTRQHGEFTQRDGVWWMGTLHPAAVLRNPLQKEDWFRDFVALRQKARDVGMDL